MSRARRNRQKQRQKSQTNQKPRWGAQREALRAADLHERMTDTIENLHEETRGSFQYLEIEALYLYASIGTPGSQWLIESVTSAFMSRRMQEISESGGPISISDTGSLSYFYDETVKTSLDKATKEEWAEGMRDLYHSLFSVGHDVFITSPEMLNTTLAAADSLKVSDLNLLDVSFAPEGFLVLPRPVTVRVAAGPGGVEKIEAISWRSEGSHIAIQEWRLPYRYFNSVMQRVRESQKPPMMQVRRARKFEIGRYYSDPNSLHKQQENSDESTGIFTGDDAVYDDPDHDFSTKFVMAFLRLAEQEVSVERAETVNTGTARNPRPPSRVRLSVLRREATPEKASSGEEKRKLNQHRWVVRMHRRRQWYPSLNKHKIIFVGPYVKGPEDAPMLDGPVVRAMLR